MKIIHLTDLHLVPPGEKLWGLDPFARFDAALNDIAAHHADAGLVAITGDLAERGETAAYELLRDRLSRFPLPVRLMLGNHDDRANYLQVFGGADASGHVQGALELGGAALLFLDTLKGRHLPPAFMTRRAGTGWRRHWPVRRESPSIFSCITRPSTSGTA